ncbi:MAG: signal protein PDZ, partial [Candidatus Aminicenantes bacterium]|nr:signal protein PDZ [Candidatus Aminicenantes bacterium]
MKKNKILVLFFMIIFIHLNLSGNQYINHEVKAEIFPDQKKINVLDKIRLPDSFDKESIHILLHGNLKLKPVSENIIIREVEGEIKARFFGINTAEFKVSDKIPLKHYEIIFRKNAKDRINIELAYSGEIYHELKQIGAEYARGFSETPGIISNKGVYLSGSTFWVPWFNEKLVSFNLIVKSPEKWSSVSQGKLIKDGEFSGKHISEWSSPDPMDEIYLISAPFHTYKIRSENVNLFAYMRNKDDNLAMKYLNTTGQYLEMYNKLIGQYPYSKFALIENFWETGYGMASFTLLGPKVIRFPFILHS